MNSLDDILQIPTKLSQRPDLKKDWARQKRTAEEVISRFEPTPAKGTGTILLADEVGMGKTYVALAVMARHIISKNGKVLLVVPDNPILSDKWLQEIQSFDETYVRKSKNIRRQRLRPLLVRDHWELVQNLHDYKKSEVVEIFKMSREKTKHFEFLFRFWYENRGKQNKKKDYNNWEADFLKFCSSYPPKIFENFLSVWDKRHPGDLKSLKSELDNGNADNLNKLAKLFSTQMVYYKPNIFIISMGRLKPAGNYNERLLYTYIVGQLKDVPKGTRVSVYKRLSTQGLIANYQQDGVTEITDWRSALASSNLWGLKVAADQAIRQERKNEEDTPLNRILRQNQTDNKKLLSGLKNEIFRLKLEQSRIKLAVVDEVHNWKNKKNGAEEFRQNYAPGIRNKLIMSATPIQMRPPELKTLFLTATGEEEKTTDERDSDGPKNKDRSMNIVDELVSKFVPKCDKASRDFSKAWGTLPGDQAVILREKLAESQNNGDTLNRLRALHNDAEESEILRNFCRTALDYREALVPYEKKLKEVAIRHTKNKSRRFHCGQDFKIKGDPAALHKVLYPVPGYGRDGESALLDFIGMRAQQRIKKALGEKGSATLLRGMNSSYQAFEQSWRKRNPKIPPAALDYVNFFKARLAKAEHPKVLATVERAVDNYKQGRKTLVFCVRLETQSEIKDKIAEKLEEEHIPGLAGLPEVRDKILDCKTMTMEYYLSRSIMTIQKQPAPPAEIEEAALKEWDNLLKKNPRAGLGKINARQMAKLLDLGLVRVLLEKIPFPAYPNLHLYADILDHPPTLKYYRQKFEGAPVSDYPRAPREIIKNILTGPNIWHPREAADKAKEMHGHILKLLQSEARQLTQQLTESSKGLPKKSAERAELWSQLPKDLAGSLLQIPDLLKVLLRLDTLAGLNPKADGLETTIAKLLSGSEAGGAWDSAVAFLRLLGEAKGSISPGAQASRRQNLWSGLSLAGENIVYELNGEAGDNERVNLCAAFNSPLWPDILICTEIGSEGIDLHQQCAEVIHHDLCWNPARLEQRTGRVDRVGSLAEREKGLINIGIPFLASNYDDFQYKTVLGRAERQEVLLGQPDYSDSLKDEKNPKDTPEDEEYPTDDLELRRKLPEALINFLKVDLALK